MAQCDHSAAQCVESTGGLKRGRFCEEYRCECGATGQVRGRAEDPPQEWQRYGEVFR
jgi:hypothetical protein